MITKLETLSTHKTWGYLFDNFSTTYTADEFADLVYEALCYLNEGQFYLKFFDKSPLHLHVAKRKQFL